MVASKCCTGHKRHCHSHCPCPLDNQSRCGFNVYFAMCGKKKKKKLKQKNNITSNNITSNNISSAPKNGGFSLSVTEINKCEDNSSDNFLDEKEETKIEFNVKSNNAGNIKNAIAEGKSSGQRNSFRKDTDFNLILSRLNILEAKISNLENKGENRLSFKTRNGKSTVHLTRLKNGKQKRYTRETFDMGRNDKKTFHLKKDRSLNDDFRHKPSGSRGRLKKWQVNSRGVSPDGYETSVSVERTGQKKVHYSDSESTTSDEE